MHEFHGNNPDAPLRVLQVASTSLIGGAERMILQLARHADPTRLDVSVLSLLGPGLLTDRARETGAEAVNWGLRGTYNPLLVARMRRHLARGRYDLVHAYGLRADLVTRPAARSLGIPCISSISSPDPWRGKIHVWLDRASAPAATAWVAVCEAARQSRIRREHFPPERIHVVLNGIEDAPTPGPVERAAARLALGIDEDQSVLLVIGNIRPAKGYPDLIAALGQFVSHHSKLVCLCVGRDDTGGFIPELARQRGLASHIRWLGFIDEIAPLFAAADLLVSASLWEGLPINLIEAMRAALPIVATEVGGVGEIIDHEKEGYLVPPEQPDQLAEGILTLLSNPDQAKELGRNARRRYEKQLRVERMIEELTQIYERYAFQRKRKFKE